MKTRAAVLHEFNAPLVIEELDLDGPQPGEVTVKVAATGICHSNYHGMAGSWSFTRLPMIPGDEGSGTVVEVGDGVTSLQPGDPVVLSWTPYCRSCFYCNRGNFNLCRNATAATRFSKNGEPINIFGTMSSFAEYTVVATRGPVPSIAATRRISPVVSSMALSVSGLRTSNPFQARQCSRVQKSKPSSRCFPARLAKISLRAATACAFNALAGHRAGISAGNTSFK